jgi:hypothetical protein
VAETRSYELIRYVNKDGSFGMVDDPTRVPRGATIIGRERKTVTAEKPAPPAAPEPDPMTAPPQRPLSAAEQRVVEAALEAGLLPDAAQHLDEVERERAAAVAPADRTVPPRR